MEPARARAELSVSPVLVGQVLQTVTRHVARGELRNAHDPASGLAHSCREFGVFVDEGLLIPAAMGFKRRAPQDPGKARIGVELAVGATPEARTPDAEPRAQGKLRSLGPAANPVGKCSATHPRDVATPQALNAPLQVVIRVVRMG